MQCTNKMEQKRREWLNTFRALFAHHEDKYITLSQIYPLVSGGKLNESAFDVKANPDKPLQPTLVLSFRTEKAWKDRLEREWDRPDQRNDLFPTLRDAMGANDNLKVFLPEEGIYEWLWVPYARQSIYAELVALAVLRECARDQQVKDSNLEGKKVRESLIDVRLVPRTYVPYAKFQSELVKFFGLDPKKGPAEYLDTEQKQVFRQAIQDSQLWNKGKDTKWSQLHDHAPAVARRYNAHVVSEDRELVPKDKNPNLKDVCQQVLLEQVAESMVDVRNRLLETLASDLGMIHILLQLRHLSLERMRLLAVDVDAAYLQHLTQPSLLEWTLQRLETLYRPFVIELTERVFHHHAGRQRGMLRPEEERLALHLGLETAYYKQLLSDLAWELYTRLERFLSDARVLSRAQWEEAVRHGVRFLPPLPDLLPAVTPPAMLLSRGLLKMHCMCYQQLERLLYGLVQGVYKPQKTTLGKLTAGPAHEPDRELCGDFIRKTYLEDILLKQRKEESQLDARPAEAVERYSPSARATRGAVLRLVSWLVRNECFARPQAEVLLRNVDVFWQQHLALQAARRELYFGSPLHEEAELLRDLEEAGQAEASHIQVDDATAMYY
jgi:hypothetical protein